MRSTIGVTPRCGNIRGRVTERGKPSMPLQSICGQCGRVFSISPSRVATAQFCSRACEKTSPDAVSRQFWARVICDLRTGCWKWTGARFTSGYGQYKIAGRPLRTHRYSWELHRGPIPDGLLVCHSCDVQYAPGDLSYRTCLRPDHLFLGTTDDNMADMTSKQRSATGERHASRTRPETRPRGPEHGERIRLGKLKATGASAPVSA